MNARMENPVETNQQSKMAMDVTFKDYDNGGGRGTLPYSDFVTQFMFYAIIAIFLMAITLVAKLLCDCDREEGRNEGRASESSRLLSSKEEDLFSYYGTSGDEDDIESGTGTGSCSTSSSEDLYDGKICVICYDQQRNSSFIPCGHCITCYSCAKRITIEESRSCPICRTSIDKVRTLIKIL